MTTDSRLQGSEPVGYQWIIDPAGHRWKVVGLGMVVAHLEDAEGRQLNVGRSLLRNGFASGAWKEAEFEEMPDA